MGEILRENCQRAGDFIVCYGGEAFVRLRPSENIDGDQALAARIVERIQAVAISHGAFPYAAHVSVNGGVAAATPTQEGRPLDLIAFADAALYRATVAGRNQVMTSGSEEP